MRFGEFTVFKGKRIDVMITHQISLDTSIPFLEPFARGFQDHVVLVAATLENWPKT